MRGAQRADALRVLPQSGVKPPHSKVVGRRDSPPAFSSLIDGADKHATSAANFNFSGFGREGYYADGIGASGVGDFYAP